MKANILLTWIARTALQIRPHGDCGEGKSENSISEGENKNHNAFYIFIESGIYATNICLHRGLYGLSPSNVPIN